MQKWVCVHRERIPDIINLRLTALESPKPSDARLKATTADLKLRLPKLGVRSTAARAPPYSIPTGDAQGIRLLKPLLRQAELSKSPDSDLRHTPPPPSS